MADRDRPIVIEGDEYRDEERALITDPIIVTMARAVTREQIAYAGSDGDFMAAALAEYKARGGNRHRTIGGPARAIRRLLDIIDQADPENDEQLAAAALTAAQEGKPRPTS